MRWDTPIPKYFIELKRNMKCNVKKRSLREMRKLLFHLVSVTVTVKIRIKNHKFGGYYNKLCCCNNINT